MSNLIQHTSASFGSKPSSQYVLPVDSDPGSKFKRPYLEDLFEGVFRGRGQTQHAEVTDEARGHGVPAAPRRGARRRDGHVLERRGGRERTNREIGRASCRERV